MPTHLAWRVYPEPTGTYYTQEDLQTAHDVECLFDYCQILEAQITAQGWQFLIKQYGVEGLLSINERSGWWDGDTEGEAREELLCHARQAGYDPEQDCFGVYDEETGIVESTDI